MIIKMSQFYTTQGEPQNGANWWQWE